MNDTQNKILLYLKTTKEANVYKIMHGAGVYPYGGSEEVRKILSGLVKIGLIKRGTQSNYRILKKQPEDKQINLF